MMRFFRPQALFGLLACALIPAVASAQTPQDFANKYLQPLLKNREGLYQLNQLKNADGTTTLIIKSVAQGVQLGRYEIVLDPKLLNLPAHAPALTMKATPMGTATLVNMSAKIRLPMNPVKDPTGVLRSMLRSDFLLHPMMTPPGSSQRMAPIQQEVLKELFQIARRAESSGKASEALTILPPGMGKTLIAGKFISNEVTHSKSDYRVFFLIQNKEILDEASVKIQNMLGLKPTQVRRVYGEDSRQDVFAGSAQLVAATRTSFFRQLGEYESWRKSFKGRVYVVLDEAQHVGKRTGEFNEIIQEIDRLAKPGDALLGLSATPWHLDSDIIERVFKNNVVTALLTPEEKTEFLKDRKLIYMARLMLFRAMAQGYLSPLSSYHQVRYLEGEDEKSPILMQTFLRDWSTKYVEMTETERFAQLKKDVTIHVPLVRQMVKEIVKTVRRDEKGQLIAPNRGVIFVPSISHANIYAFLLNQRGKQGKNQIEARAYHSGMSDDERANNMDWFRDQEKKDNGNSRVSRQATQEAPKHKYLFAIRALGEGVDEPRINHVILAKPYSDEDMVGMLELIQNLGRGSRLSYAKSDFTVSDFTGDMRRLIFEGMDQALLKQFFTDGSEMDMAKFELPAPKPEKPEVISTVTLDYSTMKEENFKAEQVAVPEALAESKTSAATGGVTLNPEFLALGQQSDEAKAFEAKIAADPEDARLLEFLTWEQIAKESGARFFGTEPTISVRLRNCLASMLPRVDDFFGVLLSLDRELIRVPNMSTKAIREFREYFPKRHEGKYLSPDEIEKLKSLKTSVRRYEIIDTTFGDDEFLKLIKDAKQILGQKSLVEVLAQDLRNVTGEQTPQETISAEAGSNETELMTWSEVFESEPALVLLLSQAKFELVRLPLLLNYVKEGTRLRRLLVLTDQLLEESPLTADAQTEFRQKLESRSGDRFITHQQMSAIAHIVSPFRRFQLSRDVAYTLRQPLLEGSEKAWAKDPDPTKRTFATEKQHLLKQLNQFMMLVKPRADRTALMNELLAKYPMPDLLGELRNVTGGADLARRLTWQQVFDNSNLVSLFFEQQEFQQLRPYGFVSNLSFRNLVETLAGTDVELDRVPNIGNAGLKELRAKLGVQSSGVFITEQQIAKIGPLESPFRAFHLLPQFKNRAAHLLVREFANERVSKEQQEEIETLGRQYEVPDFVTALKKEIVAIDPTAFPEFQVEDRKDEFLKDIEFDGRTHNWLEKLTWRQVFDHKYSIGLALKNPKLHFLFVRGIRQSPMGADSAFADLLVEIETIGRNAGTGETDLSLASGYEELRNRLAAVEGKSLFTWEEIDSIGEQESPFLRFHLMPYFVNAAVEHLKSDTSVKFESHEWSAADTYHSQILKVERRLKRSEVLSRVNQGKAEKLQQYFPLPDILSEFANALTTERQKQKAKVEEQPKIPSSPEAFLNNDPRTADWLKPVSWGEIFETDKILNSILEESGTVRLMNILRAESHRDLFWFLSLVRKDFDNISNAGPATFVEYKKILPPGPSGQFVTAEQFESLKSMPSPYRRFQLLESAPEELKSQYELARRYFKEPCRPVFDLVDSVNDLNSRVPITWGELFKAEGSTDLYLQHWSRESDAPPAIAKKFPTLLKLVGASEADILSLPGVGRPSLLAIRDDLSKLGLKVNGHPTFAMEDKSQEMSPYTQADLQSDKKVHSNQSLFATLNLKAAPRDLNFYDRLLEQSQLGAAMTMESIFSSHHIWAAVLEGRQLDREQLGQLDDIQSIRTAVMLYRDQQSKLYRSPLLKQLLGDILEIKNFPHTIKDEGIPKFTNFDESLLAMKSSLKGKNHQIDKFASKLGPFAAAFVEHKQKTTPEILGLIDSMKSAATKKLKEIELSKPIVTWAEVLKGQQMFAHIFAKSNLRDDFFDGLLEERNLWSLVQMNPDSLMGAISAKNPDRWTQNYKDMAELVSTLESWGLNLKLSLSNWPEDKMSAASPLEKSADGQLKLDSINQKKFKESLTQLTTDCESLLK